MPAARVTVCDIDLETSLLIAHVNRRRAAAKKAEIEENAFKKRSNVFRSSHESAFGFN